MKEQLQKHLKDGEPWEKMATDIPGVFIVLVPGSGTNPKKSRLMLEINPVNEEGKPKKRRGIYLSDRETYIQYYELLSDDRINKLLLTLEEVNPKNQEKSMKKLKIE